MNVVDSSGWLEYFADEPNADFFAAAVENTEELIVPVCARHTSSPVVSPKPSTTWMDRGREGSTFTAGYHICGDVVHSATRAYKTALPELAGAYLKPFYMCAKRNLHFPRGSLSL